MKIIKPAKLKKNDLIGVIAPASSPSDLTKIDKGVKYLESCGYKVEVGKNVGKTLGYLSGSDEERLDDLHSMFANKKIKAIICVRGGYGSPRLIEKINYNLIKNNPKIFVGYSDITALQLAFLRKSNLVTFAGPMVAVDFNGNIDSFTEENFWCQLTSTKIIGKLNLPENQELRTVIKGKASGQLVGGNLSLLISILGSEYFPKINKRILIIEEIEEAPYRIDRMLNQLVISNVFSNISGLILGKFVDCEEKDSSKPTLTLAEVFDHYLRSLDIPTVSDFPFGHIKSFFTIPYGINVKINSSKGYIEFLESAVV
ncbi:MAG: LD-carboxypeptidase [Ignavibacterium sp.]